jgi:hypothetical protein
MASQFHRWISKDTTSKASPTKASDQQRIEQEGERERSSPEGVRERGSSLSVGGGRRQWRHKWRHGITCAGPHQALVVGRSGKPRGRAGERRSRPAAAESARLQLGFWGRGQARGASKTKSSRRGLLITTRKSKAHLSSAGEAREQPGKSSGRAAPWGFEEVRAWEETREREREEVGRVEVLTRAWLKPSGPTH